MEIHELNTFSGTLGSGDYFATDNGTDTSKVSAEAMLAPLNARIDNIIAGPASSAEEVVDGRLGAEVLGSKTYPSLGAAIRGQATDLSYDLSDLKSDIADDFISVITSGLVEKPNGINLFDKYSSSIERGQYYYPTGSVGTSASMGRILVEVPVNGTFSMLVDTAFFGSQNAVKIPIFKVSDGSFIASKTGALDSDTNILTLTGLDTIEVDAPTCYIGYTFRLTNIATSFITDEVVTEIPSYSYKLNKRIEVSGIDNTLNGKTAVFMGDSICDATAVPSSQTDYYHWGWAGRIGTQNSMTWANYGVSGASITRMSGRGCIQDQLTRAISNHPNADYIILEGGTNDADVIESDPNYSIGTFDKADYTSMYDTTTFCGAFETMLRNAINAYPTKKIGYIIPQKMGQYTASLLRRRELFDIAKQICAKWGVPCIDVWGENIINPKLDFYYDSMMTNNQNIEAGKAYVDGQHLTDAGYDFITPAIELWMKNMR